MIFHKNTKIYFKDLKVLKFLLCVLGDSFYLLHLMPLFSSERRVKDETFSRNP